jgi:K+-transporting ATPase ATPase C chain
MVMRSQLRPLIITFFSLIFITGVIYPLIVTGLSQVFFSSQANGSMIEKNGKLVGSKFIGQNFTGDKYFWGRPSATSNMPYNAFNADSLTGSSGSNLGPLSQTLINRVQERVDFLKNANFKNSSAIPVDLVTSSGSGLDPHISVEAAYFQISRVAQSRGVSKEEIIKFVDRFTENRQLGLFGEPRINVLMLNLALDDIQ